MGVDLGSELFPLRSLPWQSGLSDGPAHAIEPGPFGDADDYQEIRLLLRTCGA